MFALLFLVETLNFLMYKEDDAPTAIVHIFYHIPVVDRTWGLKRLH